MSLHPNHQWRHHDSTFTPHRRDRLNDEARKALQLPEVAKRLVEMGLEIALLSGGEFGAFMQAEAVRWGKVIKDAGIKLD